MANKKHKTAKIAKKSKVKTLEISNTIYILTFGSLVISILITLVLQFYNEKIYCDKNFLSKEAKDAIG